MNLPMSIMEWWEPFWATYNTVIFSIGVNAMLALSIYVTLSCGLLSLANAAFMGIGAYVASLITMEAGLSFPVALAAGGILPALVALVIGIPTLRLSGVYLAMATLGFGEVVRVIVLNMEITGGPMGLNGVPPVTEWWHIVLLLGATIYFLARVRRSKIGRAFEAIKEDEVNSDAIYSLTTVEFDPNNKDDLLSLTSNEEIVYHVTSPTFHKEAAEELSWVHTCSSQVCFFVNG